MTDDVATLSDADWRAKLTAEEFRVLRKHGTERAGTSPLNAEKRAGTFSCAGCGQPLYDADTKYESGSGWPSFFAPLQGAVGDLAGPHPVHGPHRGALRPLRRPSRARVPGRAGADRRALLHERRGAALRAEAVAPLHAAAPFSRCAGRVTR